MNCSCGNPIPKERAEEGYSTCINCSSAAPDVGFMVFDHKTAPQLVRISPHDKEAIRQANNANRRKR